METLQPKLRFPEFAEKYINKRVDDFAPLQRGFDLPITKMEKENSLLFFQMVFLKHIMNLK